MTRAAHLKYLFISLLILLASPSVVWAGLFCSDAPFNGVVDGDERAIFGGAYSGTVADPFPTQITIDTDCTFQNFSASNPLTATLNFQTNDPSVYLITFNNVYFTGNMACANIDHRIWFVNGSDYGSKQNCQELFIPVEAIDKQNPAGVTAVGIGDPFTYTLTIPVLYDPVTQTVFNAAGSDNDLHSITITDDLNATGADLVLVGSPSLTWSNGTPLVEGVDYTFDSSSNDPIFSSPGSPGSLKFVVDPGVIIPAGDQILVNITAYAADTIGNQPGTTFVNTAKWSFGRLIDIDGVPTFFDPLPGENGISEPLVIAAPNLIVTKDGSTSAANLTTTVTFTIDVENVGGVDAWNTTVLDLLPDNGPPPPDPGADIGMCDFDPTATVSAEIVGAATTALTAGVDYVFTYNDASHPTDPCQLSFVMQTANAVIGPGEHLIITYDSQLDVDGTDVADDGTVLTNVAAATQWFSADPAGSTPFRTFNPPLDPGGTPAVIDHQDNFDVTATLSGYVFLKTVSNVNTGENPATTAVPGDTLRYTIRLFNFTETITDLVITDVFDATEFDLASFNMLTPLPDGTVAYSYNNAGATATLTIQGDGGPLDLDPVANPELLIDFEIDVASSGLNNGDLITNQATGTTSGTVASANTDDPFVNGVFDPDTDPPGTEDSTDVVVQAPGTLAKDNPATGITEYTIGDRFTYRITVPAVAVNTPLYDVRITDVLENMAPDNVVDLGLVSATDISGTWNISNSGTATSPILEDLNTGIDLPAGVRLELDVTVEVLNVADNQAGALFSNSASYEYSRNNNSGIYTPGGSVSTPDMSIVEPQISVINKTASNTTPTAGEIVTYTIEMTASAGANFSDVFDVAIVDSLDLGLVYVPDSTIVNGVPTTNDPDIVGDGAATAQTLFWGAGSTEPFDIDIPEGATITFQYQVQVLDTVLAGSVLNNTAIAQWTSLDGAPNFERDGSDGIGGLNDYTTAPVIETLTIPDINASVSKQRISDTYDDQNDALDDPNVRIGDIVRYTLTIPVPEGTLVDLVVEDVLPAGLVFESVVSINTDTGTGAGGEYVAVAPFSYPDIPPANITTSVDGATGETTVTWNLGNINNQPLNDLPDDFVIEYIARVADGVLAQVDNTNLTNNVSISYDTASGTQTTVPVGETVSVLQPDLSVTKSVTTVDGDSVIVASETITYIVEIINNGTAPAYDTLFQDTIPDGLRLGFAGAGVNVTSITLLNLDDSLASDPAEFITSYDSATGLAIWNFSADAYTIPADQKLHIEYQVQADAGIAQGLTLTNVAQVQEYYSTDTVTPPSDGGVTGTPEQYTTDVDDTDSTSVFTAALPAKSLTSPVDAAVGDLVTYQITVPGVANTSSIFDVQITDTLDANLAFVSANITGGVSVVDNSTAAGLNVSVAEIPANTQVTITMTARVRNVLSAQRTEDGGLPVPNTVAYNYAYNPGGPLLGTPLQAVAADDVNIVEPVLTINKTVTPVTAAPITGGDILQYQVTLTNGVSNTSTAHDVNIVDTLDPGLTLDTSFTPTITINGANTGNTTPSGPGTGPLVWGRNNADDTLDIPVGQTLVLTYRVLIDATVESNITLNNLVVADWTSQDGIDANERTGVDGLGGLNDYITDPADPNATTSVTTVDTNTLAKSYISDSFAPLDDSNLRVGDTVVYELSLNLQEGTTRQVAVQDVLPASLEFDSIISINGDTVADPGYTAPLSGSGSNFSYAAIAPASLPSSGDTGTLTFTIGDVANDPLGDATTDSLIIRYQARVRAGILPHVATTLVGDVRNEATLSYLDGLNAAVTSPVQQVDITVWQPVMDPPSKTEATFGSPASVDITNDIMQFTLQSCNSGLAPAYAIQITDDIPPELDETTITGAVNGIGQPDVTINGGLAANDGSAYSYVAPAGRGGDMQFDLITPVQPGQCVTIQYSVGFYSDIPANSFWDNVVTVDEYWSLPGPSGQQYPPAPLAPAIFTMTNSVVIDPPTKVMTAPADGEAVVGELVTYEITVPGTVPGNPVNATLFDIDVSDDLDDSLEYIGATVTELGSGNAIAFTDNTAAATNNVAIRIDQLQAGQRAVVEITARVANNANANGGFNVQNEVSYSYAFIDGGASNPGGNQIITNSPLITEPEVAVVKSVTDLASNPVVNATAGDILLYTLTMTTSGGAPGQGDNFSDAYDISIIDDLSPGLSYVTGTARVNNLVTDANGNTIADPSVVGDGSSGSPETLTWQLSDATADIDISEGTAGFTVSYQVRVLDDVLIGQSLSNDAEVRWTSIDNELSDLPTEDPNERDGSGSPDVADVNDYFTSDTTSVSVPDNTQLSKSISADTSPLTGVSEVRIGDVVEYRLSILLEEGQTDNVVLRDELPPQMAFEGVIDINGDSSAPYASVAPFSHGDVIITTGPGAVPGSTRVTFDVGNVINNGDNDPTNDTFIITYHARVLDGVITQNAAPLPVTNDSQLDYVNAGGPVTLNDPLLTDSTISVLQPELTIAKSVAPQGNDTVIDAGELINYTLAIENIGDAPAYDVRIEDVLPEGLRNGAATITMVSTTLTDNPNPVINLTNLTPTYDPATGLAVWDFDNGDPAYSIPADQILTIEYQVQADDTLGAGLTLTNLAEVSTYYSFDDDAVPALGGVTGVPEIYTPAAVNDSTTLTTPTPGALLKQAPSDLGGATTVAIGDTVSYQITVPSTPLNIALHDVRIIDNIGQLATAAAGADGAMLEFVAATASTLIGGTNFTVTDTDPAADGLILEDLVTGIDIPAGDQVIVNVTVRVLDDAFNVAGNTFNNTADYSYNQLPDGSGADQLVGVPVTSGIMTIVEPDLTVVKTGPAIMQNGFADYFTIQVTNNGGSTAWNMTIDDALPNLDPALGGMCDIPPVLDPGVDANTGVSIDATPLSLNTDYTVSFANGAPTCSLSINMLTDTAGLPPGGVMEIVYAAELDTDTPPGSSLTNVAGVTSWFSLSDSNGRNDTVILSNDGTPGDNTDEQDAWTVATQVPVITVEKGVQVVVNPGGAETLIPGDSASPGDVLQYTITIENVSTVPFNGFYFSDEIDGLNASGSFVPGSLTVTGTGGGNDISSPTGGSNGTGQVLIENLNLDASGGPNDTITIVFRLQLLPSMDSGRLVLNQGAIHEDIDVASSGFVVLSDSDDPALLGFEDPTVTTIVSAPILLLEKTSADINGAPLIAGETLRYTLRLRNIGNEDLVNAVLSDQIPANTTYVANTTTLNGVTVADPAAGVSALEAGMPVNSPGAAAGFVGAAASGTADTIIRFDVIISPSVVDGTAISNQGFVVGDGAGIVTGALPQQPSDDPGTATADDPTIDIVGNLAVIDVVKTVAISNDIAGSANAADVGDTLTYTIIAENIGAADATGVVLTDALPAGSTYVTASTTLNGAPVPDIGSDSALFTGMDINSPGDAAGTLPVGSIALITFDVIVGSAAIPNPTVISNQGFVSATGLATEPSDADGIDSNGDQPTNILVGEDQVLLITKEVNLVGGTTALPGGILEYIIRVTNVGLADATDILVRDNLDNPVADQMTYVNNSLLMNGVPVQGAPGVTTSASDIEIDYATAIGDLPVSEVIEIRFRVTLDNGLSQGDTVTNTAQLQWSLAPNTDSASVSVDIGGIPGSAVVNGTVWHDTDFDNVVDNDEALLADWIVELYLNDTLLSSTVSDTNGVYQFSGLVANLDVAGLPVGDPYEIRFTAPNAVTTTATLGDTSSDFNDGPQRITQIYGASGASLQSLDMPRQPNGIVYDSVYRTPVAGVQLRLINQTRNNQAVPDNCLDDPAQQGQVTLADGYFKFDINFSDASGCAQGDEYEIQVQPPGDDFVGTTSQIIPPVAPVTAPAQDVPNCPGTSADRIPATDQHCENSASAVQPDTSIEPGATGTEYYLKFLFDNAPFTGQIYNNHIPVDPELDAAVSISKVAGKQHVVRSELVPYTITVRNTLPVPLYDLNIVDNFPPGFKYVAGSARLDGNASEPVIAGNVMTWPNLTLGVNDEHVIRMLLIVGAGVSEGEYVNTAQVINASNNEPYSGVSSATVQVIPDPTFDCSDVIGKVFDDENMNYTQDEGEAGLAGVEVATARGLRVTTDKYGRFHITCAVVPDESRGSNFIMKVDERSLPTGYRITTENPRVERATRGKMIKFSFGATVHRVVGLDLANGVFEPESTELRPQWKSRIDMLIGELQKDPSILRLSYLGENESESLVDDRLDAIEEIISDRWDDIDCCYKLTIEKEVFWRKGKPGQRQEFD